MIEKLARRGFLGFVLGGAAAAAAPPVVGIKTAAAALGVSEAMTATEIADALAPPIDDIGDDGWAVINQIERIHYARRRPTSELPPHIATKRSWSPAFKTMVHAREEAIMMAYLAELRLNKSFMAKVKEHFLGGRNDHA